MSFKEFNVTAVAGGHSKKEGKQTLRAGRARVSFSALKLRSSTLWTAGLAFCVLQLFSAQMNSGLTGHTGAFYSHLEKQGHDTRSGWSVELSGRITNKRSMEGKKKKPLKNNVTNPEENNS